MSQPKPFFNIPRIQNLKDYEKIRLCNTLSRILKYVLSMSGSTAQHQFINLIMAITSKPGADIRTYSWNADNSDDGNFSPYNNPSHISLEDHLQGNRFLIGLRKLKKCTNLKDVEKNFNEAVEFIFDDEIELQLLQSIIL